MQVFLRYMVNRKPSSSQTNNFDCFVVKLTAFSNPDNEPILPLTSLVYFSHATKGERYDDVGEAAQPRQQD